MATVNWRGCDVEISHPGFTHLFSYCDRLIENSTWGPRLLFTISYYTIGNK